MSFPKPFLKWVGGKTQILDKIIPMFPNEMNNYREIFLGGGSVLLALLSRVRDGTISVKGKIYAYDINEPLIYLYKNVQRNHEALYDELQKLIKNGEEEYYYEIRKIYNDFSIAEKKSVRGSAIFLFLNKTCFRGLFRVGPNGFNVPYGNYNNPEIINREHLNVIHDLIQPVKFKCEDFRVSLTNSKSGDFVYLDPPYVPETKTSFVKYSENGFNEEDHTTLFETIKRFNDDVKVMLCNSDVKSVRNTFTEEKYHITSLVCRRRINSKNPKAVTGEIVIINY